MPATVWKGSLTFGLVSFPIRLSAAARADAVRFHMLHKEDGSRVREVWYCVGENKPIERSDIVKGYEYGKGKYVVVDDAELKKVQPSTATTMDILQFVKQEEVDPIFFEKSYYVSAEASGSKPYGLLRKAMLDTGRYAVAKVTMHAREHIVVIRPSDDGMMLHTMYFTNELNKANKAPKSSDGKFSPKEVDLAKRLIETLASPFRPEQYHDEYRANVERLISQKRKGGKITEIEQPKSKPVVDIMEALRQSLQVKNAGKKSHAKREAA